MQHENRWLNIRQTARYIGMAIAFVRKAVRRESIPFTRIGTKALRFDREALDAWLSANGNWGVATGPESGVFVLDADSDPGGRKRSGKGGHVKK